MTTDSIAIEPAAGEQQAAPNIVSYKDHKAAADAADKRPANAPEPTKPEPQPEAKAEPTDEEKAAAAEAEEAGKRQKTDAERERARMQRGIDRRTREREEARSDAAAARAEAAEVRAQLERLTRKPIEDDNRNDQNDSKPLSLTRAELDRLVKAEAEKLAPTLSQQRAEFERRQSVIQSFEARLGTERFNEVASDLDDALGGLKDSSGKPKAVVDAVFEADDPVKVVEWLADPDNHAEAERISKLSATQAGKAIAKLELKFEAEAKAAADAIAAEKAKAKPIPSKVPAPLEPVRGQGSVKTAPDPSNYRAWVAWANAQERKG